MINWMFFPQDRPIEDHLKDIVLAFENNQDAINSETHTGLNNLESDSVLSILAPDLERIGYQVEKSKKRSDKIRVPVLFGQHGKTNLAFEVDAYSPALQTIIEIEAGRAVVNYQFLKDFFECCMMPNVKYFCVAVKNIYRSSKDFEKVCSFFQTMSISNRIATKLEGILVIGY